MLQNLIILFCIVHTVSGKQPHIVLILADDYGFNDIGYRNPAIHTPTLDELAKEGVRLENYYVQPICTPTRSQLLSGRYQIHTGLQHDIIWPPQRSCLPLANPTLADKLKEAGYATHMIGKWHLGMSKKDCWPTRRGFDSFFGYLAGSMDYYTHEGGCGLPNFPCRGWKGLDLRDNEEVAYNYDGQYTSFFFVDRIQSSIKAHNPDKPLFLYLPLHLVHSPMQVPEQYMEPYVNITDKFRRIYAGMVSCMDEAIGNITQTLRETGLWEDTLLVFSTDNGGQVVHGGNNFPLRGWKLTLWEGGVRGIGFVTGPALPSSVRGTISSEFIHVSDWFPTLVAGVAGGSLNGTKLDGFNQWSTISKGTPSQRKELLHNIDPLIPPRDVKGKDWSAPKVFNESVRAAIRVGDWKLITGNPGSDSWIAPPESGLPSVHPHEPKEKKMWLFNIRDDPYEYFDVSEKRPDIVSTLMKRLEYYYQSSVPVNYPRGDVEANPALHNGTWSDWL